MNAFASIIVAIQVLTALGMIGLILIQHGKGADMGASFGSGSAGSLFGASGSANFLSRSTAILATVFFIATLALAYLGNARGPARSGSVLESVAPAAQHPPGADAEIPGSEDSAVQEAADPAQASTPAEGAQQIPAD